MRWLLKVTAEKRNRSNGPGVHNCALLTAACSTGAMGACFGAIVAEYDGLLFPHAHRAVLGNRAHHLHQNQFTAFAAAMFQVGDLGA